MALARRLLIASLLVAAVAVVNPPGALAACHIFTVSTNPTSVGEGGSVTVTVTRDAGVNPSSIEVYSENESAVAGQDYPAVSRSVSMSGTDDTSQSFTISTTNDTTPEGAETFMLKMRNPGGCAVNPNFNFSDTAQVTIQDNDAAPAPTAPATAAPTAAPAPQAAATTVTTAPAATTTTVAAETSTSVEDTTTSDVALDDELAADEDDDDGGNSALLAVLAIALMAGVGYVGYTLYRRRAA